MIVREYDVKDLRSVFTINKTCHQKPQPNVELLEQLHKGQTWVAVENNEVVGFLLSTYKEGPYVYNIAVLPEHRGKGIATELFKVCHQFYNGMGYIYLYVDVTNPAQKLYFDLGYRVKRIKEDFYGHMQDALVMIKLLNISAE
jgi:ribosomal protein S18 acetylase RimI-like enzyme